MESHPRQCRAGDRTFTEEIEPLPIEPPLPRDSLPIETPVLHVCTDEEQNVKGCTKEYMPVCGMVDNGIRCITNPCPSTDAITYGNGCMACADQAFSHYQGACEDLRFVVCEGKTSTGLSAEEFARDTGAICVDICPGNHDPYMTQIGIKVCTQHYGEEEIEDWPVCERSSDSCECVNAYETTRGEPIEDPEYRCVPERYSGRLIFTGGVDRLDEDGERSVMIA